MPARSTCHQRAYSHSTGGSGSPESSCLTLEKQPGAVAPSQVPFLKTSTLVSYLPPGLQPVASLRLSFNCLHFIFSLPVYYSFTFLLLQNLDCLHKSKFLTV